MAYIVVKGRVVLISARVDASSALERVVGNAMLVLSSPEKQMISQISIYVLLFTGLNRVKNTAFSAKQLRTHVLLSIVH
jgi:hypothetical protein